MSVLNEMRLTEASSPGSVDCRHNITLSLTQQCRTCLDLTRRDSQRRLVLAVLIVDTTSLSESHTAV